jgi:hypothetical protein
LRNWLRRGMSVLHGERSRAAPCSVIRRTTRARA